VLKKTLSLSLNFLLIVSLSLSNLTFARSQKIQPSSQPSSLAKEHETTRLVRLATANPMVSFIEGLKELPELDFSISESDPVVDQDPYFMRSQSWSEERLTQASDQAGFTESSGTVKIHLPQVSSGSSIKVLTLTAGIRPFYDDGKNIYFTAIRKDFFSAKQTGLGTDEGIFLATYEDLLAGAESGKPVPFFFLPLPGVGWAEWAQAFEPQNIQSLIFVNKSALAVPVERAEMESVIKAERLNLLLSLGLTQRGNLAELKEKKSKISINDFQRLFNSVKSKPLDFNLAAAALEPGLNELLGNLSELPPRGSTAGFGVYFTGFDLERPSNHFSKSSNEKTASKRSTFQNILLSLLPQAQANGPDEALMAAANRSTMDRAVRVSQVLAAALVSAFLVRKYVLTDHFNQKPELVEARAKLRSEVEKGWAGHVAKARQRIEFAKVYSTQTLGVFAALLTVLSQVAPVSFANTVEYSLDRFAPRFSSQNSLLRKFFLEKSIFRSRSVSQGVAVTWRMVLLGAGIIGGVDTLFVYVQLKWVTRFIVEQMSDVMPFLESRVNEAYHTGGQGTQLVNVQIVNEVMRNVFGYAVGGGYGYVAGAKGRMYFAAENFVNEKLKSLTFPEDTTEEEKTALRAQEKERLLSEFVEAQNEKLGLPHKDQFLFDTSTLFIAVFELLGYKGDPKKVGSLVAVAQKRPGLVHSSLLESIRIAKLVIESDGDSADAQAALKILTTLQYEAQFLRQFLKSPLEFIYSAKNPKQRFTEITQALVRVRQSLVALTYEGDLEVKPEDIPSEWAARFGQNGAASAARLFRRGFLAVYTRGAGYSEGVVGPTRAVYLKDAQVEALQMLRTQYEIELNPSLSLEAQNAELMRAHEFEYRLLTEERLIGIVNAVIFKYKPFVEPKEGWFVSLQKFKALWKSDFDYQKKYNSSFDVNTATAEQLTFWKNSYIRNFQHELDLYIDYTGESALEKEVVESALESTKTLLSQPGMAEHLEKLEPYQRALFEATAFATNEARSYVQRTSFGSEISATSPLQPGRWQWVRQTAFFKKDQRVSRAATRVIRVAEAFFSPASFEPGLKSFIYRNIPISFDTTMGIVKNFWNLPNLLLLSWGWNRYVWGADIDLSQWFLMAITIWTITGPSDFVDRLFTYQGIKTMGGVKSAIFLAIVYSWVTFFGAIPQQLFSADMYRIWQRIESTAKVVGGMCGISLGN
jgi:hypothetical protein